MFASLVKNLPQNQPVSSVKQVNRNPFLSNQNTQNPFLPSQIQVQKEDKKEEGTTSKADKKDEAFNFEQWLSSTAYEALKKELGEDKLKGYAGQIAQKLSGLLNEQLKTASKPDMLNEDQIKAISAALNEDIKKGVTALLSSPEGQKVKEYLLHKVKTDAGVALGMALVGLAAFYLSNGEIPKVDKTFDIGKSAGVKLTGEFGKIQTPNIKNLGAVFKYTAEKFRTDIGVAYQSMGDKGHDLSAKGSITIGQEDTKKEQYTRFVLGYGLGTNLEDKYKFNINPQLVHPSFTLGMGFGLDSKAGKDKQENSYQGNLDFLVGKTYTLNSKVLVNPDNTLSLDIAQLINFNNELGLKNGFHWDEKAWSFNGGLTFKNEAGLSLAPIFGYNSDKTLSLGFQGGYKGQGWQIGSELKYDSQTKIDANKGIYGPQHFTGKGNVGFNHNFDDKNRFSFGLTGQADLWGTGGSTPSTYGVGLEMKFLRMRPIIGKDGKTEFVPLWEIKVDGNYDRKLPEGGGKAPNIPNIPSESGKINGQFIFYIPGS
jgi:hypothetical protein